MVQCYMGISRSPKRSDKTSTSCPHSTPLLAMPKKNGQKSHHDLMQLRENVHMTNPLLLLLEICVLVAGQCSCPNSWFRHALQCCSGPRPLQVLLTWHGAPKWHLHTNQELNKQLKCNGCDLDFLLMPSDLDVW